MGLAKVRMTALPVGSSDLFVLVFSDHKSKCGLSILLFSLSTLERRKLHNSNLKKKGKIKMKKQNPNFLFSEQHQSFLLLLIHHRKSLGSLKYLSDTSCINTMYFFEQGLNL